MIPYLNWINYKSGLDLEPDLSQDKRHNENAILFLAHLIMLQSELGSIDPELITAFKAITIDLRAYNLKGEQVDGCYDRGAGESLEGLTDPNKFVRNISLDNILGILCGSILTNSEFHKDIQRFGAANNGLYDNVSIDKPRFLHKNHKDEWTTTAQWHPRDIFFWQYFGGNKKVFLLWPLYALIQILGMFSGYRNTSSKLLGILRLNSTYKKSFGMRILRAICFKILKRQYGADFLPKIYKIYFWQDNHPLPKIAYELYKYGESR